MEEAVAKLKTKLTQLSITAERTVSIVDNGRVEVIERHQKTLKTVINEASQLRIEIEAYKIANEVNNEELSAWNTSMESQIAAADRSVETSEQWLDYRRVERESQEREEQIRFEIKLQETKAKLQAEL